MAEFVSAKALVLEAQERGYAIPAFNTNGAGYDLARAALEAAQELAAPVILQVYEPNAAYRGFAYFVQLAAFLHAELGVRVPVALQLDHGKTVGSVKRALAAGFTSVMFDASHQPLEVNIAQTGEVLAAAARSGASVEAEVGYVTGNEPKPGKQIGRIPVPPSPAQTPAKTRVKEAVRFVGACPVDMLAVAIGTTHGVYEQQTDIDFALLAELRQRLATPLVMHGTSGIDVADLRRLARSGMAKINFGEPLRYNYIRYFNELTDDMEHLWHPWRIMQEIMLRLKADMRDLILALGADGKAG